MKKTLCILSAFLGIVVVTEAQTGTDTRKEDIVDDVSVENLRIERNGKYITIDMLLDLSGLDVDNNRAVLLTPWLVNGNDSLDLQSVGIYGRRRYYFYIRNGESMLSGKDEKSYKVSEKPNTIEYHNMVPYAEWMNSCVLLLRRSDYGCCHTLLAEQNGTLGRHSEAFFPELVYVHPQGQIEKRDSLEGSAFIDFPVDQTVIYPNYRHNAAELEKIQSSIDSVRSDADITITSVWLKGYASPESPYAHNKELAIGRTAALKKHIQQLYRFEGDVIITDHEPEDWAGLRRHVERSNLEHLTEIIALIDSDLKPDAKELKIKHDYPAEYRFLLQNCYPALRRTDYRISYIIRSYSDVEEIKRIMRERPQKLSLNEFYLAAQEYEPGTDEFAEVFETAVRMFPDDSIANLNAANAAMRRGDLTGAKRYLAKAGNSPEAVYARGALAIRQKDYDNARRYLNEAKSLGLEQAGTTLEQLENGKH
ncbi:DUF3868 domain-containing protein [Butyricimonas sp. Marseille-P3923]|uniref:DUF3868 domain-containing protein n=1 Tax=Butyricimonas sp. Marseille-P3923 TaxID=1987504 RepID=UPI000C07D746|nr:DUF3868 domain-containing protein [Butyricimonas sp. Marseille-P3923]